MPFWRSRRGKLQAYPWDRIEIDLQLVRLDDRTAISWVVGFLQNPPELATREEAFARIARDVFRELARIGYMPAFGLMTQFRERGVLPDPLAEVYDAWLRRDRERLDYLAGQLESAEAAIDALNHVDSEASP